MGADTDDIEPAFNHFRNDGRDLGGADVEPNDDVGASSRHVLLVSVPSVG
jgi:hypothetical protein